MREIKFRAYVENNIIEGRPAEIYRVTRLDWDDNGIVCAELFSPRTKTFHRLNADWFTLIQYIGLKDRNGKESYFDDLIRWGKSIYQIVWDEGKGIAWLRKVSGNEVFSQLRIDLVKQGEVIGNIYEHSYLLDKKTEK